MLKKSLMRGRADALLVLKVLARVKGRVAVGAIECTHEVHLLLPVAGACQYLGCVY